MRSLQDQSDWCARTQWALAVAMVAILAGFYLFAYRPVTGHRAALRQEFAAKQRQFQADQSRAQTLPAVQAEVDSLRMRLERFDKRLPRQQELGQFIESLGRLREQASLRRWECQPSAPKRMDLFCELPMTMKFEGDFISVFSFLRQLEDMPRLTRVRSISIKSHDAKLGQVEVQMAMNIYFAEG